MGLFSKETPQEELFELMKKQDISAFKKAIRRGGGIDLNAKIDTFFCDNCTLLQYAVSEGYLTAIELLLKHGANIEEKDYKGKTALFYTIRRFEQNGSLDILLKYRANINAQDNKGRTALFCSLSMNYQAITKNLLKSGIDISIKDNKGNSALMYIQRLEDTNTSKRIFITHMEEHIKSLEQYKLLTIPLNKNEQDSENWIKAGADNISFIGKYPHAGYELTEIFNLRSRQQIIIRKDLETKNVTMSQPVSFNDIDKYVLKNAIDKFKKQGGILNEELALNCHTHIQKKKI